MIVRTLATCAILASVAVPVFADGNNYKEEHAARYYVGQDPKTKKCSVLFVTPDRTNDIQIGGSYTTEASALGAMAAAPECRS